MPPEIRMPDGMTLEPNVDATKPTGMCGEESKCSQCPSDFLCYMKAKAESEIIRSRPTSEGKE